MTQVLDIVALRSFVGIADCGGFHRAAAALHLTQSAISQHVRKLEKVLGKPLVVKDGRRAKFTDDGEHLLAEGRRLLATHDEALRRLRVVDQRVLMVGSIEHAADLLLPELGVALRAAFPDWEIQFRLDRTARLAEAVDRAEVDLAVLAGMGGGPRSRSAGIMPLAWYAAPGWVPPQRGTRLPVVVYDDPCVLRRIALDRLAEESVRMRLAAISGDLAGVLAATRAGLGVTLLPTIGRRPEGLVEVTEAGLPVVEPVTLRVKVRRGAADGLASAAAQAVRTALGPVNAARLTTADLAAPLGSH